MIAAPSMSKHVIAVLLLLTIGVADRTAVAAGDNHGSITCSVFAELQALVLDSERPAETSAPRRLYHNYSRVQPAAVELPVSSSAVSSLQPRVAAC